MSKSNFKPLRPPGRPSRFPIVLDRICVNEEQRAKIKYIMETRDCKNHAEVFRLLLDEGVELPEGYE